MSKKNQRPQVVIKDSTPEEEQAKLEKSLDVIKLDKKAEGEYIYVVMPYAFGDCRIEKIKIEDLIR